MRIRVIGAETWDIDVPHHEECNYVQVILYEPNAPMVSIGTVDAEGHARMQQWDCDKAKFPWVNPK